MKDGSALPGLDGYSKADYIFATIGNKIILIIMGILKLSLAIVKAVC